MNKMQTNEAEPDFRQRKQRNEQVKERSHNTKKVRNANNKQINEYLTTTNTVKAQKKNTDGVTKIIFLGLRNLNNTNKKKILILTDHFQRFPKFQLIKKIYISKNIYNKNIYNKKIYI